MSTQQLLNDSLGSFVRALIESLDRLLTLRDDLCYPYRRIPSFQNNVATSKRFVVYAKIHGAFASLCNSISVIGHFKTGHFEVLYAYQVS
jgi:hypothetical protein